jgi:hypothetical protein
VAGYPEKTVSGASLIKIISTKIRDALSNLKAGFRTSGEAGVQVLNIRRGRIF